MWNVAALPHLGHFLQGLDVGDSSVRDLQKPFSKIIVNSHAGYETSIQSEIGASWQLVMLAVSRRPSWLLGTIFSIDDELRGSACAILTSHYDDIGKKLDAGTILMFQEGPERGLSVLATALVDVVIDVFGEAGEHVFEVAPVERCIIAFHKRNALPLRKGHLNARKLLSFACSAHRLFHEKSLLAAARRASNARC